jgi:hypothetical protein
MSSKRHRPLSRKGQRSNPAVKAIRERRAVLPFRQFHKQTEELVDAGALPPGCRRITEALARCHEEHGQGVANRWLLIGLGNKGQKERVEARKRSHAEPPVHVGLAEEAGLSRRWTVHCLNLLQAIGLRKWWGGPKRDPRDNHKRVLQRPTVVGRQPDGKPVYGERREHRHGIGGSGLANGYTVEGIPDPPYDGPRPPAPPEPDPEPPWAPPPPWAVERVRQITEGLARDGVERQRRRLREEEERRQRQEATRGP